MNLNLSDPIENLTQLQTLNLYSNKLQEIQQRLVAQRTLFLEHFDQWNSSPPLELWILQFWIASCSHQTRSVFSLLYRTLTKSEIFNLGSNNISTLPKELWNLSNLQTYSYSAIVNDLPEIGKLTQLKELGLGGASLTEIPDPIENLSNLERLDIRYSNVTSLPWGIAVIQATNIRLHR